MVILYCKKIRLTGQLRKIFNFLDFHSWKRALWLVNSWSRALDQIQMYPPRAEYNSINIFSGANVTINFYNSKWFCIPYWGYKSIFYFFMYFETFVTKLRFFHSAGLTICVSGQVEPPRRMFYRSGNMNQDVQSEILSRNLSSFLKPRTHSQHLKMDVHNWCPVYISMLFDIDNLLWYQSLNPV